jgi:CRISPR-associated endonuclease/helicase Cas3
VIDRDPARVIPWLEACRPSSLEAISLPIGVVRRWLRGDAPDDAGLSDTVTSAVADAADDGRRNSSEELFVGWRWAGDASEPVTGRDLRPGDILVVDATRGGIAAGSFDPESSEPVIDLGDLAQLRGRGIASLRLESGAMRVWGFDAQHASVLKRMVEMPDDATTSERREGVRSAIALLSRDRGQGAVATADDLVALQEALQVASGRRDFGLVKVADRVFLRGSIASTKRFAQRVQDATSEDDLSAFVPGDATLASHSALVRDTVQAFAEHLGLPDTIVSDLAIAGWLHDTGKADPRFQKWLLGGSEIGLAMLTQPLAKSAVAAANAAELRTARERSGYPAGYRHEELSVAMAQSDDRALANASDVELVLHLIASHHGGARPFAAAISELEPVDVELAHGDLRLRASTAHGLARLDSGVADRFWRLTARYGWWGLAWCEALLRLADHRASEAITQEGA